MAPGTLPIPPSTAAVKAFSPGKNPIKKLTCRNIKPYKHPGGPGHHSPQRKSNGDYPVDVNAHQGRHVFVLGHGPHGFSSFCELNEIIKTRHHQNGANHNGKLNSWKRGLALLPGL
jgi:hypothetical protein